MYSKQYRKPSVREALKAAREELGAHALVLSTDLVAVDGWRGWLGAREVQMTAAVDRKVSESRPPRKGSRQPDTDPARDGLVARLIASGVDPALAALVAKSVPDAECRGATIAGLRRALAALLGPLTAGDEDFARAEVFIGPPGVGKTTTIAKIAARERAGHGRALGMVAADGFRAGAVEQLRIYATIIGSPFKVARNVEELDKALSGARQPLLVDTAGRSPNDPAVRDLLHLLGKRRLVRTHLVMAADTSANSARRILDAYEGAHPDRLVITKIDEAESLNPLLAVLRERPLPVSFITAGQRVPEDLDRATPALLASAMLRELPLSEERHS
jgi:flagellar biosynthesis protein FlhF